MRCFCIVQIDNCTSQLHLVFVVDWLAHENAIFDVDWMPGESQLLTASGDKTIVLWDLSEEKKLATFEGHICSVKTAKFQPDNKGKVSARG